jgi:hypothetical protein
MLRPRGAIDTLVKHFASVLGGSGIRIIGVAPGVAAAQPGVRRRECAGGLLVRSEITRRAAAPGIQVKGWLFPMLLGAPVRCSGFWAKVVLTWMRTGKSFERRRSWACIGGISFYW